MVEMDAFTWSMYTWLSAKANLYLDAAFLTRVCFSIVMILKTVGIGGLVHVLISRSAVVGIYMYVLLRLK